MSVDTQSFRSDLIIDVGMHTGEDTAFYLRKGFRVVAVEANPALCAAAEERFQAEIASGQLTIIAKAIAPESGSVSFWVNDANDEWSSLAPNYVTRNTRVGAPSTLLTVSAIRFEELLRAHGVPYYLKIDIEGVDDLCVRALREFAGRPRFVSVETSGTNDFSYTFGLLAELYSLGYRHFKLVNQHRHQQTQLPKPAREGKYIQYSFPAVATSGPFGEETTGQWAGIESTIEKYQKVLRLQARYTVQAKNFRPWLSKTYYRVQHLLGKEPVGWYDIHAKYEADDAVRS